MAVRRTDGGARQRALLPQESSLPGNTILPTGFPHLAKAYTIITTANSGGGPRTL